MLNARIRKVFAQKGIPIFSAGNPGDLTYNYTNIGNKTDDLKNIFNNEGEFHKKLLNSKKPIIIIGESILELKSGNTLLKNSKKFLKRITLLLKNGTLLTFYLKMLLLSV